MALSQIIIGLFVAASFPSAPLTSQSSADRKTVQISIDVNAAVLITTANHKQIGFDSRANKSVNEIPEARILERENSQIFILPYVKSGEEYTLAISGKETTQSANISMTGPGFIIGIRNLTLRAGEIQTVSLLPGAPHVAIIPDREGSAPTLFITMQSDRSRPSYRFEVTPSPLARGKGMWMELDMSREWLLFGSAETVRSDETKKSSFSILMRRTNPGGTRDVYTHRDVSLASNNLYRMQFGEWDGKGDLRFCYARGNGEIKAGTTRPPRDWPEMFCTPLKNETAPMKFN